MPTYGRDSWGRELWRKDDDGNYTFTKRGLDTVSGNTEKKVETGSGHFSALAFILTSSLVFILTVIFIWAAEGDFDTGFWVCESLVIAYGLVSTILLPFAISEFRVMKAANGNSNTKKSSRSSSSKKRSKKDDDWGSRRFGS